MVKARASLSSEVEKRASHVQLVLTDCDGVLTDGGVYYTALGEEMKRFSMRDGMGMERLRTLGGIKVEVITKETSPIVAARAAKLKVPVFMGVFDKLAFARDRAACDAIPLSRIAFIGDDVNDLGLLREVGISACPVDAEPEVAAIVDIVCRREGGHGAFRELAELILASQSVVAHRTYSSLEVG